MVRPDLAAGGGAKKVPNLQPEASSTSQDEPLKDILVGLMDHVQVAPPKRALGADTTGLDESRKRLKVKERIIGLGHPSISHREELCQEIYNRVMELEAFRPSRPANYSPKRFQYPIFNEFPAKDTEPMQLNPLLAGVRLQDYHVWKFFVAAKGDFAILSKIHNESFTKDGIRQNRVPIGRPAVVQTKTGQWMYVTIGNVMLVGDVGARQQQEHIIRHLPRKRGMRLRSGVPKSIGNGIPTVENLKGRDYTIERRPEPMVVNISDGLSFQDPNEPSIPPSLNLIDLGLEKKRERSSRIEIIAAPQLETAPRYHQDTSSVPKESIQPRDEGYVFSKLQIKFHARKYLERGTEDLEGLSTVEQVELLVKRFREHKEELGFEGDLNAVVEDFRETITYWYEQQDLLSPEILSPAIPKDIEKEPKNPPSTSRSEIRPPITEAEKLNWENMPIQFHQDVVKKFATTYVEEGWNLFRQWKLTDQLVKLRTLDRIKDKASVDAWREGLTVSLALLARENEVSESQPNGLVGEPIAASEPSGHQVAQRTAEDDINATNAAKGRQNIAPHRSSSQADAAQGARLSTRHPTDQPITFGAHNLHSPPELTQPPNEPSRHRTTAEIQHPNGTDRITGVERRLPVLIEAIPPPVPRDEALAEADNLAIDALLSLEDAFAMLPKMSPEREWIKDRHNELYKRWRRIREKDNT
ncbi:MAG: hypothetical protein Q9225_001508 [Loekoesia sp. 1 TL-2023]